MGVIPHTAWASNDEDDHSLQQSVGPKSCKNEIVEGEEGSLSVVSDGCKDFSARVGKSSRADQINHHNKSKGPEGSDEKSLNDGNKHDLTDSHDELAWSIANGNGKSNSGATAKHDNQEETGQTEENVSNDFFVSSAGAGKTHWSEVFMGDDSSVVKEKHSGTVEDQEEGDQGSPYKAASKASQQEHEDKWNYDSNSKSWQN